MPKRGFRANFNSTKVIESFQEQNITSFPKIEDIINENEIKEFLLVVSEPKAFKYISSNILKYSVFGLDPKDNFLYLDEFVYLDKPSKRAKINQEVMNHQGRYQFVKEEYIFPAGQMILQMHDTCESQRRPAFTEFFCDDESDWNVFLSDWNLFMVGNVMKSIENSADPKEVYESVRLMFKPVLDSVWGYIKYEFERTPVGMPLDRELKELASLHTKAVNAMENVGSKVHKLF